MFKFLSSLLCAMALCLAVAGPAGASTCYNQCLPTFCCDLRPDPLPGFTMVSPSYVVQDGEIMFCDSSGNFCQKDHLGAGGFYNLSQLGDWGASQPWWIKTIVSRLHGRVTLWSGTSWSGNSWSWGPNGGTPTITYLNFPGSSGWKLNSANLVN